MVDTRKMPKQLEREKNIYSFPKPWTDMHYNQSFYDNLLDFSWGNSNCLPALDLGMCTDLEGEW